MGGLVCGVMGCLGLICSSRSPSLDSAFVRCLLFAVCLGVSVVVCRASSVAFCVPVAVRCGSIACLPACLLAYFLASLLASFLAFMLR